MTRDEGDAFAVQFEQKLVEVQGEKIGRLEVRTQSLATALMEALELVLMLGENLGPNDPVTLEAMGRRDELMAVLTEAE